MKPAYLNLCTEFYNVTKSEAGPKEIAFYESLSLAAKGPVLEAMCGSGRLLIPLIKKGLNIEGVDNSSYMLQSCQERCRSQGIDVQLYNQSLQMLSLPRKYDLIFISIGSFQLIYNREESFNILENLRSALLPGGKLVLETFIPWDAIKGNIKGSTLSHQPQEANFERIAHISTHSKIIHKSRVTVYFKEQIERTQSCYEKWVNGILSHIEEEEYIVRWYHRFEMELILQKVGFSSVDIIDTIFEQNEQAVVYTALK